MSAQSDGLVPVHVGQPTPGSEEERLMILSLEHAQTRSGGSRGLPRIPAAAWQTNGLEPHWLGQESSDCAAALEPSIFAGAGADELERFLDGADRRGVIALVISMIGFAADPNSRSVFAPYDSVNLPLDNNTVGGRRLLSGTKPLLADGLVPADRDLALRLANRPPSGPWWALELQGATLHNLGGLGQKVYQPIGTLQPLLVDGLDHPIAAVWIDPSQGQRWYIVPDTTDVDMLLSWLANQGQPAYVPEALQRVRSTHFVDPALQTTAERAAHQALAVLDAEYTEAKDRLHLELNQAETAAASIRYGLLYGSGSTLVSAVKAVLTSASASLTSTRSSAGPNRPTCSW